MKELRAHQLDSLLYSIPRSLYTTCLNPAEILKPKRMMFKMIVMESEGLNNYSDIGNAKRLGVVFFVYAIALPFISFILPASENPITWGVTVASWTMILLMPLEILLIYMIYLLIGRRSESYSIMGPAALMYTVGTTPSVHSLVIGFINPTINYLAAPLGLIFSLVGLWLSLRFVSALNERIAAPE
ncbi:MAG: hypothetical protein ACFFCP_06085 [Promethearchaeota archaeon]